MEAIIELKLEFYSSIHFNCSELLRVPAKLYPIKAAVTHQPVLFSFSDSSDGDVPIQGYQKRLGRTLGINVSVGLKDNIRYGKSPGGTFVSWKKNRAIPRLKGQKTRDY